MLGFDIKISGCRDKTNVSFTVQHDFIGGRKTVKLL